MSAQQAGRRLRNFASLSSLQYADSASLHGFRRGRAQWLVASRKPLSVVLQAGGWSSAAFLGYLDREEVTEAAFLDLLLEEDEAEAVQVSSSSTLREMVPAVPAAQGRSMQQTGIRSFLPSGSASR